jgi:hypothetical protein
VEVAGVRLSDGRQVFVEGAPPDLATGAQVRFALDGVEMTGLVSIPPPQIIWRDPAARCARFYCLERMPDPPAVSSATPVEELFLAERDAPDPSILAAMLALALEASARLDA